MAVENIGNLVPTKIPALSDDANIQDALKAYHYGSYDFNTAETNTANLLNPSIAYSITNLQTQITTKAALEVAARDISRATTTAPSTNLANGLIWIKKGSSPLEMYVYNGDTSTFNRVI